MPQTQSKVIETFSVGMVELSLGSDAAHNTVIVNDNKPKVKVAPKQSAPKEKTNQNPTTKTTIPVKGKQTSPEPNIPGNPIPKPITNPSLTGSNTDNTNSKDPR